MYESQRRTWREFNGRNLKDYEDDNQKRINNYVEPRSDDVDDWQTHGFEGITREKMFAFVSKVAMTRPKYKFKATRDDGFIDKTVASVVEDVHTFTRQTEDPTSTQFFFDAWQAAGSGTVIRWEGVEQTSQTLEEFESYDITTGEIKGLTSKTVVSDINCRARRVRLLDFLIADWYQPDLQLQPFIAEIFTMSRFEFERLYGKYKHADKIPKMESIRDGFDVGFYMQQWENLPQDRVHVTHFYSKENDKTKFVILANGVMILSTPIPRKDGRYPYARGIFKPHADSAFFYGKALPDEIASDQDIYNAFKNMVIDRSILHIQRPLIGTNLTEIENETFSPNGILNVKGGDVKTMDFAPPSQADITILEYLRAAANRQTSDVQQSGQTGRGVTAREIVIADENARKLAGVSRMFLEDFDLQGTKLRVGNIMQFYFEPTRLNDLVDEKSMDNLRNLYRTITLENQTLSDQKQGLKVVKLVGASEEIPSKEDLDVEEMMAKLQGFEMEKLVVNASYIKNFEVDLLIISESSFEQSRSLELAMQNEYIQVVANLFPQQFQQFSNIFFRQYNEIYGKDMSEFERAQQQSPTPVLPQVSQGQGPGIGEQLVGAPNRSLARLTGVEL